MTVQFVGAQANAGTTVTIPAHSLGDLILLFAYRDGNQTPPAAPAAGGTVPTWNLIGSSGANSNASNFRYAIGTGITTSGTWTNATEIVCLVYRGVILPGASAGGSGTATTTISYPALTLQRTNGSSWVVGVAGHRTANNVEIAPSGMINRIATGTEAAGHDTNGVVTSWTLQNVTVNASSAFRSWTVELRDGTPSVLADARSYALSGNNAELLQQKKLTASKGVFALTGNDALFATGYAGANVKAEKGALALTGNGANLLVAKKLAADPGWLLLPEQNLVYNTTSYAAPYWKLPGNTGLSSLALSSATAAPDGSNTAYAITENASGGEHFLQVATIYNASIALYGTGAYTASFYYKNNGAVSREIALTVFEFATEHSIRIFLNDNTTAAQTNITSQSVTSVGSGWYRAVITFNGTNTNYSLSSTVRFYSTTASSYSYTGNGANSVFVWGLQLEKASSVSKFDPTSTRIGEQVYLKRNLRLLANGSSFSVSGKDAALIPPTLPLSGSAGSFAVSGNNAGVLKSWRLAADPGAYAASGQDAGLSLGAFLSAASGSAALAGQAAALTAVRRLSAASGAVAVASASAPLRATRSLPATAGSFVFAGQSAGFNSQRYLSAQSGAFETAGVPAELQADRRLSLTKGAFDATPVDAELRVDRAAYGSGAAFLLSGVEAGLLADRRQSAETGAFTFGGNSVGFNNQRYVAGQGGLFAVEGYESDLLSARYVLAEDGSIGVSGQASTLSKEIPFVVAFGTLTLEGGSAFASYRRRQILVT